MRFPTPLTMFLLVAAAAGAALLTSPSRADPIGSASAETAQHAVWTSKQVRFTYMGFTTHYSCQGLADKVRKALLTLGARKDLRVEEGACERPGGGPEPFPNVVIKMNVLQPLATDKEDANAVAAHWRNVDLNIDRDALSQAADCELLEQIKHTFFPLFTTRNVDYHVTCAAHQVFPGGTWLRADVLTADHKPDAKPLAAR